MYLKNGLAEREVGGRERDRSEYGGEDKRMGRIHF